MLTLKLLMFGGELMSQTDINPQRLQNQVHKKMTKDVNFKGSSQQSKEDLINRRNGQGPEHLKLFLLVFLNN